MAILSVSLVFSGIVSKQTVNISSKFCIPVHYTVGGYKNYPNTETAFSQKYVNIFVLNFTHVYVTLY